MAVDVEYDHRSTHADSDRNQLGGDLGDAQLQRLETVARACPLRRSIETGVEFVETIERRENATVCAPVEPGGASSACRS